MFTKRKKLGEGVWGCRIHDDEHDAGRPDWFRVGQFIEQNSPAASALEVSPRRRIARGSFRLSYRLLQGFTKGRRVGGRDLAAHSVGVATSAAWTGGAIVAMLA